MQSPQTETSCIAPQHLVTNLEYVLKLYKKTKFFRARIDTCANVSLMPISVYQLLYKDCDRTKLAPSNKVAVKTYTTVKMWIVGSCNLFVVHPDTKYLMEVTFQVTSHEGSVIVSCVRNLALGLIQPHSNLDSTVPDSGSLISSKADHPLKKKTKKIVPVSKLSDSVNSRDEQSPAASRVQEIDVNHCANQEVKAKCKQQNCQVKSKMCSDKKCQEINLIQPVKQPIHMQSVSSSGNKKSVKSENYKTCQATICYTKQKKSEYNDFQMCSDKNCQENENVNMQPVKPEIMNMQLPKPAVPYEYRRLCKDKNCQSTTCYSSKKKSPVRPMYEYDKNCQSAYMM